MALDQRYATLYEDSRRGPIYDVRFRKLAVSMSAESIVAIPAQISDARDTAAKLSEVLDMDYQSVYAKLTQPLASVYIKRRVDQETAQAVKELRLPGIVFTEKGERFYPSGSIASHVLGIVGTDNQGLEGLELEYDEYLSGKRGRRRSEVDARGRDIPLGEKEYIPPEDGYGIVLTIDERIQMIAEREIERAVVEANAARGTIIMMNPKTGGILALATYPSFDLTDWRNTTAEQRRMWPLLDAYEPGSTFKIVTAAAVLDSGTRSVYSTFDDIGYVLVDGHRLRCWRAGGHGHQTFVETMENSCNPAFATYAREMGVDVFYRYIRAFGFGLPTGIDFPGDSTAKGMLQSEKTVGAVGIATIGFGQGIAVTPLQLLQAIATVANGGTMMKPRLVEAVVDERLQIVEKFPPVSVRQVISPSTAQILNEVLVSVVENGSGTRAQIPGYLVAGKTGTAQKVDHRGGYGDKRVASFGGYAPADDPVVAALVIIDEPNTYTTYGGVLAAPAFQAAVSDALRLLGVPPNRPVAETVAKPNQVYVPDVRNYPVVEAAEKAKEAGLGLRIVGGQGNIVLSQNPVPGAAVQLNTVVNVVVGDDPE
jgi:stage V sporulation protein D (sporulation-specific penicillin-binding protein)